MKIFQITVLYSNKALCDLLFVVNLLLYMYKCFTHNVATYKYLEKNVIHTIKSCQCGVQSDVSQCYSATCQVSLVRKDLISTIKYSKNLTDSCVISTLLHSKPSLVHPIVNISMERNAIIPVDKYKSKITYYMY